MLHQPENSEKIIIFPSINPAIVPSLQRTYSRMKKSIFFKKRIQITSVEKRRCNRCGIFFNIEETILRRYYNYSSRKYRLCKDCSEHLKKYKK